MKYALYSAAVVFLLASFVELFLAIRFIKDPQKKTEVRTLRYVSEGGRLCLFGFAIGIISMIGTSLLDVTMSDYLFVGLGALGAFVVYGLLNYYWKHLFRVLNYEEETARTIYTEYRFHFRSMLLSGLIYCWSLFFIIIYTVSFIKSFAA